MHATCCSQTPLKIQEVTGGSLDWNHPNWYRLIFADKKILI